MHNIIDKLLNYSGLNAKSFSEKIGLERPQAIYDLQKGKTQNISPAMKNKIISVFPEINVAWLMTGEGNMLNDIIENRHNNKEELPCELHVIPLLPTTAQGGSLNDFIVSVKNSDCERVVSPIKGADYAIAVAGESMSPEYPSGSQILIKKIDEELFIEWGKVYVLDTRNGIVIKKLMPGPQDGIVKCVSINPEYPPFDINMNAENVFGVYRVLMCMSIK